ncbi:hypothetical protein [Bacillus sp. Marseille-Q1617]|uniref:hypothetical protein n=1 Tax=Bacillus sp. Marseille-Q1617 TaxID=2736887 RepID=UPI001588BD66|nr:hypothetical protein [Bacillus sp. Marseille-Q1617]
MKPSDNQHHINEYNQQKRKRSQSREQDYHDLILSTIQTCESLSIKPTISMLVDFSGLSEEKILEIMETYYKKNSSTEKLKKLNDNNGSF